jgi:hypothetical protein
MNSGVEKLIQALREELQQYGEMLAQLDAQQEQILRRAVDDLPVSYAEISAQGEVIRAAREAREEMRREIARGLRIEAGSHFQEIIPLLPADYRPLLSALVDENNRLLIRIHQRVRQNHMLLMRSVELMVNFMSGLVPNAQPAVYGASGIGLAQGPSTSALFYNAVG